MTRDATARRRGTISFSTWLRNWKWTPTSVALVLLTGATFFLRAWQLDGLPPALWWDEAGMGLAARDVLRGRGHIFFPHSLGTDPLFIYLITPFVALWDTNPVALRLPAAILGALTVPAIYAAGRMLWRDAPFAGSLAGITAAALWATNYWPQSVNRLAFPVSALPLMLTLAVVAWLLWTDRPTRRRGIQFGIIAGLTCMTYLAARITPLLWMLLYLALPVAARRRLRPTVGWAAASFLLMIAPMALYFVVNPESATERVAFIAADSQATSPMSRLASLFAHAWMVIGIFLGVTGDPVARHNLPGRPPFSPLLAALFVLGFLLAGWHLRHHSRRAFTLLIWCFLLSVPAVIAADVNPHFLRLFGALPAALLIAAWPITLLVMATNGVMRISAAVLLSLLILSQGVSTVTAYFGDWARHSELDESFLTALWDFGTRAESTPGVTALIPIDPNYGSVLAYAFQHAPILQTSVDERTLATWLDTQRDRMASATIITPIWWDSIYLSADPKQVLLFYLEREGRVESRAPRPGYELLTIRLGGSPDFRAPGNTSRLGGALSPALTLVEARWGAAYPNENRNGRSVAAGTKVWAIYTWRMEQALPDMKVTLDLVDGAGHLLSSAERPLVDAENRPVSQWVPGKVARSYHLVELPVSHPPGPIALEARAYQADSLVPLLPTGGTQRGSLHLGTMTTVPPLKPIALSELRIDHPHEVTFPSGVTLLGFDAWPATVAQGGSLTIKMYWRIDQPFLQAESLLISVGDSSVTGSAEIPAGLVAGAIVHTYVDLHLPPPLAPGAYSLSLSPGGDPPTVLGEVMVSGRLRRFDLPSPAYPLAADFGDVVTLLGVDAPLVLDVAPGGEIRLPLVWRVRQGSETDLVRFVHLLSPDGRLVAQQDTQPCDGGCASRSWIEGEVLIDEARVIVPDTLSPGRYTVGIGWYDRASLQRLSAADSNDNPVPDNLLRLPLEVRVRMEEPS